MDREKTLDILTALLEKHKVLLHNTCEIKRILLEAYDENSLDENIIERGLLIDKIDSSVKYYNSVKERHDFDDTSKWKLQMQINELLQQIQQLSDATAFLNVEITSLIRQRIKDITISLEKIQESKHLANNLKKHVNNTPSLIDICG